MNDINEFNEDRPTRDASGAIGWTAVRVALLFGSLAIALTLIVTPMISGTFGDRGTFVQSRLDRGITSSTVASDRTYHVRRSVLQKSPSSVCIIDTGGKYRGDC